jgi:aspartyl-tRNA(Asn)/glutamyl-tRNA(Gln) amidotransferase subunit C
VAVDPSEVRKLARLAQLALSDAEMREVAGQLDRLLEYVSQLQTVDVSQAEPWSPPENASGTRPDVSRPGLPRALALRGAPSADAGLFEVPRVVVKSGPSAEKGEVGP